MSGIEMLRRRMADRPRDARVEAYTALVDELRHALDSFARADPDEADIGRLRAHVAAIREITDRTPVDEEHRLWAHWRSGSSRVQCMVPELLHDEITPETYRGTVTIGDFFLGMNGAAHGGVLPLIFDEALGRLAGAGRSPGRTAYLTTTFRAVTPIGVPLGVSATVERIDGRKRFITGEIRHGGVVCAEAEALFIELRPDHR
ncbi:PaaI family thioesterase [Microbacterium sp. RD1]|uniref:PaaI family thioesterase n=1 Tax=Microbacterium sp. RD1 TaxID=3457313 RepID=UPI003FA57B4B